MQRRLVQFASPLASQARSHKTVNIEDVQKHTRRSIAKAPPPRTDRRASHEPRLEVLEGEAQSHLRVKREHIRERPREVPVPDVDEARQRRGPRPGVVEDPILERRRGTSPSSEGEAAQGEAMAKHGSLGRGRGRVRGSDGDTPQPEARRATAAFGDGVTPQRRAKARRRQVKRWRDTATLSESGAAQGEAGQLTLERVLQVAGGFARRGRVRVEGEKRRDEEER